MILKIPTCFGLFIKPSSGSKFVPNKVTFSLYLFLKYVGGMSYCTCDGVGFLVTCSSLYWLLVSEL